MNAQIATLGCYALIGYLLWSGGRRGVGTGAIWLPFCWMFLAGSRFFSHWLSALNIYRSGGNALGGAAEGSPIDMPIFLALMLGAWVVLARRSINWAELLTSNKALLCFYAFGLVSILWTDYPLIAVKRLIKSLGTVSMALVILTEAKPYEALDTIIKRLAFVLLPLSILFIKYYPHLGRDYHVTGGTMFTGVTMQKNSLGQLCMLTGLYFWWSLLHNRGRRSDLGTRPTYVIYTIVIAMAMWLLAMADSATSMVCLAVAASVHLLGMTKVSRRRPFVVLGASLGFVFTYGVLELLFGINAMMLSLLNRRPDLTTRVPMWEDLLESARSPLLGYGWQSFSLSEEHQLIADQWSVLSTHNTYLDIYLNIGIAGLILYGALILTGVWKIASALQTDYEPAVLRFSCIAVIVLYGWTETVDLGVSNTYLLLLLGLISPPALGATRLRIAAAQRHTRRPYPVQSPV